MQPEPYCPGYWAFVDNTFSANRHVPREPQRPLWQGPRSPWRATAYILIFAAVLVLGILWAGGRFDIP